MGIEHPDDRQHEEAVTKLKRRCREFADRVLLETDGALALSDEDVNDNPDIEEADFLHGHEMFERIFSIMGKLLRNLGADRLHQAVKCAKEEPHVEPGPAIEGA